MKQNKKIADNYNLELKQKINNLDNEIELANKSIKNLDEIKECFITINNSFNKCFNLLQNSIKGKKSNAELDEMTLKNSRRINKITESIDEDKKNIHNKINELLKEKEDKQKEYYKKNDKY